MSSQWRKELARLPVVSIIVADELKRLKDQVMRRCRQSRGDERSQEIGGGKTQVYRPQHWRGSDGRDSENDFHSSLLNVLAKSFLYLRSSKGEEEWLWFVHAAKLGWGHGLTNEAKMAQVCCGSVRHSSQPTNIEL